MSFEEFTDYILRHVLIDWKEEASVSLHKVMKNNGTVYTGLYIREGEENMIPAIYLEPYFDKYNNGDSLYSIIRELRQSYEWSMARMSSCDFDLTNYNYVKDKLIYRLVNYEKNKEMLNSCPYIRLEDLALTFRWLAHEDSIGISTALVTFQELELWDVTGEDILLDAQRNTMRLFPGKIMQLDELLSSYMESDFKWYDYIPMYIVTNQQQINGACVILYDDFLKDFVRKNPGNYYILPSSIHEMILLPADSVKNPESLKDIVHDANRVVVYEDEFLSDSVYYYDSEEDNIRLASFI